MDEEVVECKDGCDIDTVPDGWFLGSNKSRSEGVEEELECADD